ncbi:MAG: hypothetical protein ACQ9MH_03235 [Nitrospinales bacterium]
MPSSTSSFKTYELERVVPRHHWTYLALITIGLTMTIVFCWEMYCRHMNYIPTLNDTTDLWSSRRTIVDEEPSRTVLIGASRMLFNFNLEVYEKEFGERPIQLATVGSSPRPYLEDLADHPEFSGTVIVGVTPWLYFAPGGPPVQNAVKNLDRFKSWSPTQKVGHQIGMFLQNRFAFIQQSDLTLNKLLLRLKIPNRPKAKVGPELPPHFHDVNEERQGGMTDFAERDEEIQKRIQQIWIPLFTPPPSPPGTTKEQIMKKAGEMRDMVLEKTKVAVDKIRARGGKVIFIRYPSTGGLRELENKITPRAAYWDKLLETTNSPGIHFEDHPQLQGFDCPEWSHLTKADAKIFSKRLMPLFADLRANGKT